MGKVMQESQRVFLGRHDTYQQTVNKSFITIALTEKCQVQFSFQYKFTILILFVTEAARIFSFTGAISGRFTSSSPEL